MSEKQMVEFNVVFEVKDIWRYNLSIAYKTMSSRIIVLIALGVIGWLIYGGMVTDLTLDAYLSQNIFYIAIAILLPVSKVWRIWKVTAAQVQLPAFSGRTFYRFKPENIYIVVGDLQDTVPWTTYSEIVETKYDFRLFVDPVQAQIIPKHNMTDEQIEQFKQIVKQANPAERYKLM